MATDTAGDGSGPDNRYRPGAPSFGPNTWLVEDMYDRYRADPESVSPSWREFFADYRVEGAGPVATSSAVVSTEEPATTDADSERRGAPAPVAAPPASTTASTAATATPAAVPAAARPATTGTTGTTGGAPTAAPPPEPADEVAPLRGAAGRIVANMEASLAVPTATSVRAVPAGLLEVNRTIINDQLERTTGGKVSFTHLIGFAVVKGLAAVPAMNASFVADADGKGTPGVVRRRHVGLGLAVDVEKPDGSRTLLVPCIADADAMDFRNFVSAYEELIRKIATNKVAPDDFAGTTVTLTNPGTLGTAQSVPRLMPGQGLIVGVGALGLPTRVRGG